MLVVKIEMWPGGDEDRRREIGRMYIANKGFDVHPDHPRRGDYVVRLMRRGAKNTVQRTAEVLDYPRESYSVWVLVKRALDAVL